MNSETKKDDDALASEFRSKLGSRLRFIEKEFKNREEAADAAGVAKSSFQRWVEARSDPSFEGLSRLCAATGFSLDWLATGEGPMRIDEAPPVPAIPPPTAALPVDEALMGRLLEGIVLLYKELGQHISPMNMGQLQTRLYNEIIADTDGPDEYPGAVKARLGQLRRELHAAAAGQTSSKRSA